MYFVDLYFVTLSDLRCRLFLLRERFIFKVFLISIKSEYHRWQFKSWKLYKKTRNSLNIEFHWTTWTFVHSLQTRPLDEPWLAIIIRSVFTAQYYFTNFLQILNFLLYKANARVFYSNQPMIEIKKRNKKPSEVQYQENPF